MFMTPPTLGCTERRCYMSVCQSVRLLWRLYRFLIDLFFYSLILYNRGQRTFRPFCSTTDTDTLVVFAQNVPCRRNGYWNPTRPRPWTGPTQNQIWSRGKTQQVNYMKACVHIVHLIASYLIWAEMNTIRSLGPISPTRINSNSSFYPHITSV